VAKYMSQGNAITTTRQTYDNCTLPDAGLQNTSAVQKVLQLTTWLLVQCTHNGAFVKYTSRENAPHKHGLKKHTQLHLCQMLHMYTSYSF